jgi:hypothetical protein
MGRGKVGQRNSNRRFRVTSKLRNATVVAEEARALVDSEPNRFAVSIRRRHIGYRVQAECIRDRAEVPFL